MAKSDEGERLGVAENPFSSLNSGYGQIVDGEFESVYPEGSDMRTFHLQAHDYIRGYILGEQSAIDPDEMFPCFLGEAAVKTRQYALGAYEDITDKATAEGVMHDVIKAQMALDIPADPPRTRRMYRTTMVAFKNPVIQSNLHAAEVLFNAFQNLHEVNSQYYPWAEGYSNDIDSPDFGFSIGRTAHFVAYFHPHASSPVRRTPYQFFVLNSHDVLDELKQAKGMDAFNTLRDRIRSLQSNPDPRAGNHGDVNEFDQYAFTSSDPVTQAKERLLKRAIFGECPFKPDPNADL